LSVIPISSRREATALERLLDQSHTCECTHDSGPCPRRASARVTVVCAAEGCDCAAAVYLLCAACVRVWRTRAKEWQLELRVIPM
jgi:hypothetical protein